MTTGQRIAQKRKELALSQEALGGELGVSRQTVYKWESDSALPEIDKLIALSRRFGVTVGWLLGVETQTEPTAENPAPAGDGELTEAQLKMVEEIAARYAAAQPTPAKSPWGKWDVRILFALCGILLAVIVGVSNKVKELNQNYINLGNSVYSMRDSLNSQIYSVSDRVEEILKAQNSLTADYGTEIVSADLKRNRVVFSAYAVPKTYVDGMTAEFSADDGTGGIQNYECEAGSGQKFEAALACQLTDSIDLSVTFISPDGTRETQLLYTYNDLYSSSFVSGADAHLDDYDLMYHEVRDGTVTLSGTYLTIRWYGDSSEAVNAAIGQGKVVSSQVGLFKNKKLVAWAQPCEKPASWEVDASADIQYYLLPDTKVSMIADDVLTCAAVLTDEYGRESMLFGMDYVLDQNNDGKMLTWPDSTTYDADISHWSY